MTEPLSVTTAVGYSVLAAAAAAGWVASDAPEKFLRGVRDAGRGVARRLEALYFPTAYELYDIAARNAALNQYVAGLNAANALRRNLERFGGEVGEWMRTLEQGSAPVGQVPDGSGGGRGPWVAAAASILGGGLVFWSLRDGPAISPVNVGDPEDSRDHDAPNSNLDPLTLHHVKQIYFESLAMCDGVLGGLAVDAAQELGELNTTTLSLLYYRAVATFKSAVAFFLVGGSEIPLQCRLRNPLPPESCLGATMIGNLLGLLKEAAERNMHPARLDDFQDIQAHLLQLLGGSFGDFELLMRRSSSTTGFFEDANACLADYIQKLLCQN